MTETATKTPTYDWLDTRIVTSFLAQNGIYLSGDPQGNLLELNRGDRLWALFANPQTGAFVQLQATFLGRSIGMERRRGEIQIDLARVETISDQDFPWSIPVSLEDGSHADPPEETKSTALHKPEIEDQQQRWGFEKGFAFLGVSQHWIDPLLIVNCQVPAPVAMPQAIAPLTDQNDDF